MKIKKISIKMEMIKIGVESQIQKQPHKKVSRVISQMVSSPLAPRNKKTQKNHFKIQVGEKNKTSK